MSTSPSSFPWLQPWTQQANQPTSGIMAHLTQWITPTFDEKELDKRINELKIVLFWLQTNAKGLEATIQALEVQKLTLGTLQSLNVNLAEMANAMIPKPVVTDTNPPPPPPPPSASAKDQETATETPSSAIPYNPMQWLQTATEQLQQAVQIATEPIKTKRTKAKDKSDKSDKKV